MPSLMPMLVVLALSAPDDAAKARRAEHRSLLLEYFKEQEGGGPPNWEHYAPRFLRLTEADPEDFVGFDSLFWLITQDGPGHSKFPRAMALLRKHHAGGGDMADLCRWLGSPAYFGPAWPEVEGLLREVMSKNPSRKAQAEACISLAQFLKNRAGFVEHLKGPRGDRFARNLEGRWGRDYVEHLKRGEADEMTREAAEIRKRVLAEYRDFWDEGFPLGQRAPEIAGEDIDGVPMRLGDHRGRVVVLDFWGFGCPPCRAMFPHVRSLVGRMEGRPFAFLGVNVDADRDKTKRRAEQEGLTWRSWWDGGETGSPIAQAWGVRGWPSTFVLDRDGTIRYRDVRGEALDVAVESLLEEMEAAR